MKLTYLKYIVESETDYVEDGIEKISSVLTIFFKLADDKDDLFGEQTQQLIVINLNEQRGFEMDNQRKQESINFVENLS